MGIFSKFEGKMEDTFEGTADKMFDAPISPVQIAKKAEKQMRREKMVGAGKQYAPTLYTVLVNPDDDRRLFGYYPTLAGETETYLGGEGLRAGPDHGRPATRALHRRRRPQARQVRRHRRSRRRAHHLPAAQRGDGALRPGRGERRLRRQPPHTAQQFGRADAAMPDQRFNQYDQYDQHDQYGQHDQYDQYGNQGYQQMPAGNGWEAQGYQAPAREPWDQPLPPLITLRRSRPLPVRSISSTPMPPAPPLRRPLPATPQVRWPAQLRDPRPCRSRRRPSRPPTP